MGSRALGGTMLQGGMPFLRYFGNRFLTWLENLVLHMNVSEYHTGYRAYSRRFLESVPFEYNSDKFEFDSEILIQSKLNGFKIAETPIPTTYAKEKSYLNPFTYGLRILKILTQYTIHRLHLYKYKKFV